MSFFHSRKEHILFWDKRKLPFYVTKNVRHKESMFFFYQDSSFLDLKTVLPFSLMSYCGFLFLADCPGLWHKDWLPRACTSRWSSYCKHSSKSLRTFYFIPNFFPSLLGIRIKLQNIIIISGFFPRKLRIHLHEVRLGYVRMKIPKSMEAFFPCGVFSWLLEFFCQLSNPTTGCSFPRLFTFQCVYYCPTCCSHLCEQ